MRYDESLDFSQNIEAIKSADYFGKSHSTEIIGETEDGFRIYFDSLMDASSYVKMSYGSFKSSYKKTVIEVSKDHYNNCDIKMKFYEYKDGDTFDMYFSICQ